MEDIKETNGTHGERNHVRKRADGILLESMKPLGKSMISLRKSMMSSKPSHDTFKNFKGIHENIHATCIRPKSTLVYDSYPVIQ